ncbi:MAG: hypothetical protein QCH31_04725 [Methanolobus sp.]|nr:hypothetical protein [Methanolobus sp.]
MAWYDIVLGVATGGLYTAGKAIYQAGNATESAGEAAEEVGMAVAIIGSTIQAVGEQLGSTLKEAEELLTVKRLTPRSEADLWDEEKARLDALRQEKTRLENKLKEKGIRDTDNFDFDFWDILNDLEDVLEKFQLMSKLAAVNQEIHDIFYQEPGVLTTGIYNAKEVLERINTIEQPMIEDILASLDDNLDVSKEVLREVRKLFVTKKKIAVPVTELSPSIKDQLEMIQTDKIYYKGLISRKDTVTTQLSEIMKTHPVNKFEIASGSIKVPKESIYASNIIDEVINATGIPDAVKLTDITKDKAGFADLVHEKQVITRIGHKVSIEDKANIFNEDILDRTVNEAEISQPFMKAASVSPTTATPSGTSTKADATIISTQNIARIATAVSKSPGHQMSAMQPYGAKISASLSTKFDGYQRNYDLLKAQKAFYFRQSLKLEKKYELLANKWVEEPGIVPKTLDELHGVLKNVRTEEQPRIDLLLDNVNETLEEAKGTVEKANETMDSVKNALSILDFDTRYLKLGAMIVGGLVVLNLFVGLIVLVRMALGH